MTNNMTGTISKCKNKTQFQTLPIYQLFVCLKTKHFCFNVISTVMHITILMLRSHREHYHTTRINPLRVQCGCGAIVVKSQCALFGALLGIGLRGERSVIKDEM